MTGPRTATTVFLLGLLAMACTSTAAVPSGPAASPSPSATPAPSASPATSVDSPAAAAALVLGSDPRFAGIGPLLPDVIGQSAWYESFATAEGFEVTVRIGWGDCPAGCINHHDWRFGVARNGDLSLIDETGDPLPDDLPEVDVTGDGVIDIVLVAGPTCPVETVPPQPGCEGRSVAGATVIVRDAQGIEVGRAITDSEGRAHVTLPAGIYTLEPQPLEGLMGTPDAVAVWALASGGLPVTLAYDTGIR